MPPCVREVVARIGSDPLGARTLGSGSIWTQAYKDRIVARLLPPESSSVEQVSREVGVSAATLERWRADALANGSGDRTGGSQRWTAAARLQALIATAGMDNVGSAAHAHRHPPWRDLVLGCDVPAGVGPRTMVLPLPDPGPRKVVGFEVHDSDSAEHAAHLACRAGLAEGMHAMPTRPVLHGDNAPA